MELTQYGFQDNPVVLLIDGGEEPAQVKKVIDALINKYHIYLVQTVSTDFENALCHMQGVTALGNYSLQYVYAICSFSSGFKPMMRLLFSGLNADYLVAESGMAVPGREILIAAREWV